MNEVIAQPFDFSNAGMVQLLVSVGCAECAKFSLASGCFHPEGLRMSCGLFPCANRIISGAKLFEFVRACRNCNKTALQNDSAQGRIRAERG